MRAMIDRPERERRRRDAESGRGSTRASSRRSTGPERALSALGSGPAEARDSGSAVRRSCQTIARWTGRPVERSQTTVVSRWFVIPIARSAGGPIPAAGQRLFGCGEHRHPDLFGIVLDPARARGSAGGARDSLDRPAAASPSTTRHVVPDVPWSIERITATAGYAPRANALR